MNYQVATVRWTVSNGKQTKFHIVDGTKTLCGADVPESRKEVSFINSPTCKRCINAYSRNK